MLARSSYAKADLQTAGGRAGQSAAVYFRWGKYPWRGSYILYSILNALDRYNPCSANALNEFSFPFAVPRLVDPFRTVLPVVWGHFQLMLFRQRFSVYPRCLVHRSVPARLSRRTLSSGHEDGDTIRVRPDSSLWIPFKKTLTRSAEQSSHTRSGLWPTIALRKRTLSP